MEKSPDISVIILSYNVKDLMKECLNSLSNEISDMNTEVVVVENGSSDGSGEFITREFPWVKLVKTQVNLGFGGGNNLGMKYAKGRYIVLLNSDAFLHKGALHIALKKMEQNPHVGLSGGKLVGSDGSLQPSARMFPSIINHFLCLSGLAERYRESKFFGRADRTWESPEKPGDVDWIPGAFSIIRQDVLEKVGTFDESFYLYYEEVDLCHRIKDAGYSINYWPNIVITHIGGQACTKDRNPNETTKGKQVTLFDMRSALLYFRKYHGFWGAFLFKTLECFWNRLRIFKNLIQSKGNMTDKINESKYSLATIQQAWNDTKGGKISPPKPW